MEFLPYGSYVIKGELGNRMQNSFLRMKYEDYDPDKFLNEAFVMNADWPGDTEGRLLLALVTLSRSLRREQYHAGYLFNKILTLMNEDGYLGKPIDENNINEQLLSGNSWLMRGIAEYYEWTQSKQAYEAIRKMAEGLFLKTAGKYCRYPMDSDMRLQNTGAESGSLTGESTNGWLPSTDIGCAFIMMDGVSHAYRILKDERLYSLLDEMITVFKTVDLKKCAFQTHASLSCARGILRAALESGRDDWKEEARRQFDFYCQNGMTANYENDNWYTRPEWTEPCAIHDSFILSSEMWRLTGEEEYLHLAHRILFNAIYRTQRHNGGFGCDSCTGTDEKLLYTKTYEAWWCCSMRGGEGLSFASSALIATEGNTIYLPFYFTGVTRVGHTVIDIESNYPYSGHVKIRVNGRYDEDSIFAFYVPQGAFPFSISGATILKRENGFAFAKPNFGYRGEIEIHFLQKLFIDSPKRTQGAYLITYGPLILGTETTEVLPFPSLDNFTIKDQEKAIFESKDGRIFMPLTHIAFKSEETIKNTTLQILF